MEGMGGSSPDDRITRMSHRWGTRDFVVALALFAATAGTVLWQNAHVTVLWDLSYVLDSSYRITLGQLPYRDYPFAHAPLTFLVQAAIIKLTGRVFWHHIVYCAVIGGMGSVIAWRIALRILGEKAWGSSVLLALPLAFLGVYGIFPHPNYDCDSVFAVLVAIWLLQRAHRGGFWSFAAGIAIVLPLFFKQNIGLPFLLITLCGIVGVVLFRRERCLIPAIGGAALAMVVAALLLHLTVGIDNYIQWTIRFPAQRRIPSLGAMIDIYRDPSLLWMLTSVTVGFVLLRFTSVRARSVGLCLLVAPFCWPVAMLFRTNDADDRASAVLALWPLVLVISAVVAVYQLRRGLELQRLIPLFLLAAIHGAFLSQQLWGSTYAVWPLLILLIAGVIAAGRFGGKWMAPALGAIIGGALLVAGGFYVTSEDRLSYASVDDGSVLHSKLRELAGMSVQGKYLPNFEELLQFAAENIPQNDGLILVNGEDPFYYATGRTPQFPILLFDPTTQPYSPEQLRELVLKRNIGWLVVKRDLQIKEDPTPDRAGTLSALMQVFSAYKQIAGYDIYRRR